MPNFTAQVSKMYNSERLKPAQQAKVVKAECKLFKNDLSSEGGLNESKANMISPQKENFSNNKEHRITLRELRETKALPSKNKSAVEACQVDSEAKTEAVKMKKNKTVAETERPKARLDEVKAVKVLKECKAEIEMALRICKEDADEAEQTLMIWIEERDAAVDEAKSLRKQIGVMKTIILSLERQLVISNVRQSMREIYQMREEFLKRKEELETTLQSCIKDVRATKIAICDCMNEKNLALLDVQDANEQLQKVQAMLNILEKKKELREVFWWKKPIRSIVA